MGEKLKVSTEIARYFFVKGIDPENIPKEDLFERDYPHKKEYRYKDVLILTEIDGVVILEYEK